MQLLSQWALFLLVKLNSAGTVAAQTGGCLVRRLEHQMVEYGTSVRLWLADYAEDMAIGPRDAR